MMGTPGMEDKDKIKPRTIKIKKLKVGGLKASNFVNQIVVFGGPGGLEIAIKRTSDIEGVNE